MKTTQATGTAEGAAATAAVAAAPVDDAGAVLAGLRDARVEEWAAVACQLRLVAGWLVLHEVDPVEAAAERALLGGAGTAVRLGGVGCPLVEEFCVPEVAAALGLPSEAGRDLAGEVSELVHRLPRVWARVQELRLPGWRARRIARATMDLPVEAAAYMDARVAQVAHRVGPVVTDRLAVEAEERVDPAAAAARRAATGEGAEARCFVVDSRQVSAGGNSRVWGVLDLADALDLDAAVAARAGWLADLGCDLPLDARRALAVGELARADALLDLTSTQPAPTPPGDLAFDPMLEPTHPTTGPATGPTAEPTTGPIGGTTVAPRAWRRGSRQVVLYVHLADTALTAHTGVRNECGEATTAGQSRQDGQPGQGGQVARLENTGDPITLDQVRGWCATPDAQITVRPVLDLAGHVHTGAYEVPDRLAEHVGLRDLTCVFPFCVRRARRCDTDHVIPHARGGSTCSENLAPLCRAHHRLKTHHGRWTYRTVDPGTYLWTSPHGQRYLRDATGTRDLTSNDADPPSLAEG
jgi:hypothetical protein